MTANKSSSLWHDFLSSLKDEIYRNENSIPLQTLCQDGVAELKEDFEISDLILNAIVGSRVSGKFTIPFSEINKTSCDKCDWRVDRTAVIDFSYDIEAGAIKFVEPELNSYE